MLRFALLIFLLTVVSAEDPMPLSFEFAKDNPLKSRIYLNPLLSMKKINELSSREVQYVKNNATNKIEEETGDWYALVSNEADPSPRYALLKNELCNEKDFRISWVDNNGKTHSNVIQRLGPSPQEWKPVAQIQLVSLKYDSKIITAEFDYVVKQDNLQNAQKLGNFTPTIQLESCELLFDKPVAEPKLDVQHKTITFDSAYADNKCTFTLHLSVLIYNEETECRDMMQSTNETSAKISLRCDQTNGYECPKVNNRQSCKMTCDPNVVLKADYHYGGTYPEPYVKVEWQLPASNKSPVKSSIVRYSQIDVIHNNHPLGEFNATVLTLTNATSIDLTPFSKSTETLYSIQVCLTHDDNCPKEPKWEYVPRHPVYAESLVESLPPPIVTTTTTTEAPTTIKKATKAANGTRAGAKKDNSTSAISTENISTTGPSSSEEKSSTPGNNKKPAVDNLVAIVTTVPPSENEKSTVSPGGTASSITFSSLWISSLSVAILIYRF